VPQEPEFELHSLERATVATVTPQDTMTLTITLDERDIGKLSLGQIAQVRVEALSNEVFTATVTAIGTSGVNSGGSSKFTAQLTLERNENMLAGMSATAQILMSILENVPTIPAAALTEDGAATVVYTGYDPKTGQLLNPTAITIGVSDGEKVQILSGLAPGQTFWYTYYDTLELSHTPEADLFPFD
jgi:macrolide-specific efflux system membrane fusion protein